jgi:hypothetical protein
VRINQITTYHVETIESCISNISDFQKGPLQQEAYAHFISICDSYKAALQKILTMPINYKIEIGEIYGRNHIFPQGNEVTFEWSIEKLNQLVATNGLPKHDFPLQPLMEWVDLSGLNSGRMNYALTNKKPVLVIDYAPSQLEVLVDGNHRVASRYLLGQVHAESTIKGILLPSGMHVKALHSDFQRNTYKIMANFGRIVNFVDSRTKSDFVKNPELFNISHLLKG